MPRGRRASMTEEQKEKLRIGRENKKTELGINKTVFKCSGWEIFVFDEYNFVLVETKNRDNSNYYNYYSEFTQALEGLLRKKISDSARKHPEKILESLDAMKRQLEASIKDLNSRYFLAGDGR